MTVYVNARFLTQPTSGVQRYARELLGALDRQLARDRTLRDDLGPVVALHPGGARGPGWSQIELQELAGGKGHMWEQGALWRASRGGVLLSLGNSGPVLHRRQVLALHDANLFEIPEAYSFAYRLWHKALRPVLARRAQELMTVSGYSADALARHLRVDRARFSIVPNSGEHVLRAQGDASVLGRHGLKRGGYWLSVGNRSPNKNIARLVAAHRQLGDGAVPLVIVGGAVPGLADQGRGTGARYLGRVSDGELRALYEAADGFVFPSLHEGFGIPPLEAMALGVPVLAARRAAMPEVLGDAAMWFDPMSVSDMARALRDLAGMSPDKRARMITAGRARAAGFSWAESVGQLVSLLRWAQAGVADGAGPGQSASCAPGFRPADKAASRPAG